MTDTEKHEDKPKSKPAWYYLTEEEQSHWNGTVFLAAWHALQPLKNTELNDKERVIICLDAFRAARSAFRKLHSEIRAKCPDVNGVANNTDVAGLTYSALGSLYEHPLELPGKTYYGSSIGAMCLASKAVDAIKTVANIADDVDGWNFVCLTKHTIAFARDILTNDEVR